MKEYLISAFVVGLTMFSGSYITNKTPKSKWYECIKPAITPPNYVFPIVWTLLYTILFFALARSLQRKYTTINILLLIVFVLNILWSYAYFAKRSVWSAFIIINLIADITGFIMYLAYRQKDHIYIMMLAPFWLWISFATVLNFLSIRKAKQCDGLR